jgi:hypothetical protein
MIVKDRKTVKGISVTDNKLSYGMNLKCFSSYKNWYRNLSGTWKKTATELYEQLLEENLNMQ